MSYQIQELSHAHDSQICQIIKQVGEEYGAVGEGFGPSDTEVKAMSQFYHDKIASRYLVVSIDNKIVGGCGIAAFNNSKSVCELRKLFLLPDARGLGLGKKLVEGCLKYAVVKGYESCYLDTLTNMKPAINLYEQLGFKHLSEPLAGTIHNGCDVWMLKKLTE